MQRRSLPLQALVRATKLSSSHQHGAVPSPRRETQGAGALGVRWENGANTGKVPLPTVLANACMLQLHTRWQHPQHHIKAAMAGPGLHVCCWHGLQSAGRCCPTTPSKVACSCRTKVAQTLTHLVLMLVCVPLLPTVC